MKFKCPSILSYFIVLIFFIISCENANQNKKKETIENGKIFNEIQIGNQIWMSENLGLEVFQNGDSIPHAKTSFEWDYAGLNSQPAWCYYENDSENGNIYGKLYNYFAVTDSRGLAPKGWHIASDNDWNLLIQFLSQNVGEQIKDSIGWHSRVVTRKRLEVCKNCVNWSSDLRRAWKCPNCDNTGVVEIIYIAGRKSGSGYNSSGFSGRPAGYRTDDGGFTGLGTATSWWIDEEVDSVYGKTRSLYFSENFLDKSYKDKRAGASVRCIRD